MCNHHTTDEGQLAERLLNFMESVHILRLQIFLRQSLTSYLQANHTAYHPQFVGMIGDLEFLFELMDELQAMQQTMEAGGSFFSTHNRATATI